jgi:sec-independent protein translocase protein TatC
MPLDQEYVRENTQGEKEMSFFDHVAELRMHILRAALAIAVFGGIFFANKSFVFEQVIFGPRREDFFTYRVLCSWSHSLGLGQNMCFKPVKFDIITRQLGEVLMQHLFVSFWLGVICAFPYIFWEFWRFIQPGLHETERKSIRGVVAVCSLLFLMGIGFGYFIIAPFSINFLAGYTLEGAITSPTLDSYVTYMTMFTMPMGIVFEMPVVAYFLGSIGVIGPQVMRSVRRYAIVIILILAAIITPPDVVSQTMVFIPLYALYEVSIVVVSRVRRRQLKALEKRGDQALT